MQLCLHSAAIIDHLLSTTLLIVELCLPADVLFPNTPEQIYIGFLMSLPHGLFKTIFLLKPLY